MAHQFVEAVPSDLSVDEKRIYLEVHQVLWNYEPIRATRAPLSVDVSAGRVTLSGRTRTESLRLLGAYISSFVPGVTAVVNEIVSDDQVIRAAADALAADPLTAPHVLQVNARYGDVTLLGSVTSPEAEIRATQLVGALDIVSTVRSDVSIVRPAPRSMRESLAGAG